MYNRNGRMKHFNRFRKGESANRSITTPISWKPSIKQLSNTKANVQLLHEIARRMEAGEIISIKLLPQDTHIKYKKNRFIQSRIFRLAAVSKNPHTGIEIIIGYFEETLIECDEPNKENYSYDTTSDL